MKGHGHNGGGGCSVVTAPDSQVERLAGLFLSNLGTFLSGPYLALEPAADTPTSGHDTKAPGESLVFRQCALRFAGFPLSALLPTALTRVLSHTCADAHTQLPTLAPQETPLGGTVICAFAPLFLL